MFYNEIFEETKVLRVPAESSAVRDWRAHCQLALWYDTHLNHAKKIILLSELDHTHDDTPNNVVVMTTRQYLDTYYKHDVVLQNLVHVLADVVLEDNEEGRIRIASKKSGGLSAVNTAVSGYSEVSPFVVCLFAEKFMQHSISTNQWMSWKWASNHIAISQAC